MFFKDLLVRGFNPFENISQNGNLPQIGVKIKNVWNHNLVLGCSDKISQIISNYLARPFEYEKTSAAIYMMRKSHNIP